MLGIIVVCFVLTSWSYTYALSNVVNSATHTISEDQIPYSIYKIRKTASYQDLAAWIENNYSADSSEDLYYLPDTLIDLSVNGASAVAFKTWEHKNYVQNLVIDKGKYLQLYTTPHGEYNPDGSIVFQEVLGLIIPKTEYTYVSEADHYQPMERAVQEEDTVFERLLGKLASCSSGNFGTKVGSFNSVSAYSNGNTCYVSSSYNYYNGYNTGLKWQCVEYADRYFKQKFNRQIRGGNANTYYSNASAKGLNRAANGSTNHPQVGNILTSAGGSYGHVAIVKEVGSNYVKVIQQNWCNCSSDNSKTLSMTVTTSGGKKYYKVSSFNSSYPVQGWLWPK